MTMPEQHFADICRKIVQTFKKYALFCGYSMLTPVAVAAALVPLFVKQTDGIST